jgi:hypothetical protein
VSSWPALAILVAAGCASSATPVPSASSTPAASCGGSPPSYQREVTPLLQRYCLSCHAPGGEAGEDHDFTRYETLHAQRRQLGGEHETGAMPPGDRPQPSRSERALLQRWACLGAPRD